MPEIDKLTTLTNSLAGFFLGLLLFLGPSANAQGTYTAQSCNYSDVGAVINGPTHTAVSGDVIQIPAGTCTWTSQLSISAGITLVGSGTANTSPTQFGAGTLNTTIIDNAGSNGPMINATLPNGQTLRISTLLIEPNSGTQLYSPIDVIGTCSSTGCPNFRLDNVEFSGWNENNNGTDATWMIRIDGVYGVADHDTIPGGDVSLLANVHYSSWLGTGSYGDNSWASPDTYGTGSAFYFENNSLAVGTQDCDEPPASDSGGGGGCRVVVRFNHTTYPSTGTAVYSLGYFHGTDTTGRQRGGRSIEIYGNTAECLNTSVGCDDIAMDFRSGSGIIFGNSLTAGSGAWNNSFVDTDTQRRWRVLSSPWGLCDGTSPYDTDDGTTYFSGDFNGTGGSTYVAMDTAESWATNQWVVSGDPYSAVDTTQSFGFEIGSNTSDTVSPFLPPSGFTWASGDSFKILRASVCVDQAGRGAGTYFSGSTPSPSSPAAEALDPIYEFDNSGSNLHGNFETTTESIAANRDYRTDSSGGSPQAQTSATAPFNGSTTCSNGSNYSCGVGFGTLANRPTSCTAGVGYWATNQGNWNQSSNTYAGGYTQGQLYTCTATNTWTLSYTPYTYPHPLVSGSLGTTGTPPDPPTGLTAVPH